MVGYVLSTSVALPLIVVISSLERDLTAYQLLSAFASTAVASTSNISSASIANLLVPCLMPACIRSSVRLGDRLSSQWQNSTAMLELSWLSYSNCDQ